MKTEFPLLNAAIMNGVVTLDPDAALFRVPPDQSELASARHAGYDLRQYGPLLLPFPDCWFEFAGDVACLVNVRDASGKALVLSVVLKHPDGPQMFSQEAMTVRLAEDGLSHDISEMPWLGHPLAGQPEIADLFLEPCHRAAFLIALLNCRNVTTEEHRTQSKAGRKSRRRRPEIVYRTIKLPGSAHAENHSSAATSDPLRFHRVRGHFKTFTAEAPLMGQHIGTYWWGWQARGSKDNGEVVSSYAYEGSS